MPPPPVTLTLMNIFSSALALPSFSLKVSSGDLVWVLLFSSAFALPSFSLKVSFGDSVLGFVLLKRTCFAKL